MLQTDDQSHCLFAENENEAQRWIEAVETEQFVLPTNNVKSPLHSQNQTNLLFVVQESENTPVSGDMSRQGSNLSQLTSKKLSFVEIAAIREERTKVANTVEELYELKEELGTGGFSVVQRNVERATNDVCALKLIRKSVYEKVRKELRKRWVCWSLWTILVLSNFMKVSHSFMQRFFLPNFLLAK